MAGFYRSHATQFESAFYMEHRSHPTDMRDSTHVVALNSAAPGAGRSISRICLHTEPADTAALLGAIGEHPLLLEPGLVEHSAVAGCGDCYPVLFCPFEERRQQLRTARIGLETSPGFATMAVRVEDVPRLESLRHWSGLRTCAIPLHGHFESDGGGSGIAIVKDAVRVTTRVVPDTFAVSPKKGGIMLAAGIAAWDDFSPSSDQDLPRVALLLLPSKRGRTLALFRDEEARLTWLSARVVDGSLIERTLAALEPDDLEVNRLDNPEIVRMAIAYALPRIVRGLPPLDV